MKINLYDVDEFVKLNHLQEVTSGVLFQRGGVPHPEGLLSNDIFGITVKSRKETFAYIDLHGHFFHPHMYKVVRYMFRNVDKIINGEEFYSINEEGILVVDRENGQTGIEFLYDNWNKIRWKKSGEDTDVSISVGMRNERSGLIKLCKRDEVFISKMPVEPVFYRDVKSSSKGGETGDLNRFYTKLIRLTTLLRDRDMFGFQFNSTNYDIQQTIVAIYDYFKQKLQKKNGVIRKYLMGKTVDNCVRTVITAPTYHYESKNDMMVDYYHCALPISQACVLCYPLMMHWLKNFFDREIISQSLDKIVYNPENDEVVKTVRLKNPASYFDEKYIKNMMDSYIKDPSSRFNPIEIPVEGTDKRYYLHLSGKRLGGGKDELSSIVYRRMTITDLLFLAASDVTKDKHTMTTRYPITDEFSVFCNQIRINSTTKTEPMMVNGHIYKWYPVIENDVPSYKMASLFIDSLQFSNSYLEGIGGDYDGDQVTVKILFSQEANEEIEKYIHGTGNFVNASGKLIRVISSEAIQTFYTFTKDYDNKKPCPKEKVAALLEMTEADFTFGKMTHMFGHTSNGKTMRNPDYNLGDTMTVPANFWNNKEPINTTVGRFVFYQMLVNFTGLSPVIGFEIVNKPVTDKVCGKMEAMISNALKDKLTESDTVETYIDMRDWFGLQMHAVVCTSFTPGILFLPKELADLKKKLIKENEEKIKSGDPKAGEYVEQTLIKEAKRILKGDPGMDLYDSGARGSFGNNYKNINLIRGTVYNEATGKYDFIANSLMDGLKKTDLTPHANTLVNGAYPKSIGTAESGYLGKELNAIMQMERIDDDANSDCGTKFLLNITLPTGGNIHDYDYRYISENGKLKCLEPSIIESYKGKTVKMRSVMYCKGTTDIHCKCAKCAGMYYYTCGKKFIGLQTGKMATTLTNLNMKKFHDNVVHTSMIDPADLIV